MQRAKVAPTSSGWRASGPHGGISEASIDAPGARSAKCPTEQAIAERATLRLLQLVNQGPFELVAHRFDSHDREGRELMVARRGDLDFGKQLIREGLAHRYFGIRRSWC